MNRWIGNAFRQLKMLVELVFPIKKDRCVNTLVFADNQTLVQIKTINFG